MSRVEIDRTGGSIIEISVPRSRLVRLDSRKVSIASKNMKRVSSFVCVFRAVLWIAFFTYLMVWWASIVGLTLGIPAEVVGLTILAAGTSIPDLITRLININIMFIYPYMYMEKKAWQNAKM